VILDAGSGIRGLGVRLARESARSICICLTHLHLDHLEGLAFFEPIWDSRVEIDVWGPPSAVRSLEQRIARYFSPPLFPMQLSDVRARIRFHDVLTAEWRIGSAYVSSDLVSHPGPTLGFRLEERGRSLAYIPDHEPRVGGGVRELPPDWISGFALASRASVLLHDCQYLEREYETRVGFGHSSVVDAVAIGELAHVERLLLFHHDPLHTDTELEALQQRARELWRGEGAPPALAYEGLELTL
jgi:ribonuclease BN (tRNA processing enzyme)